MEVKKTISATGRGENNFDRILTKYRADAFSERDKGSRFERLMKAYLQTDPKYKGQLKNVWLWEEFFAKEQFGKMDIGIDLVAETVDGQYWAIQSKCYLEDASIDKQEVDTFLSTSGRSFENKNGVRVNFALRVWISTTDKWSSNAEATLQNQTPPIIRININELRNARVDWEQLEKGVHGSSAQKPKYKLKPHQEIVVKKTHDHFKQFNRGKLIMACGTGKSFTSLKIAEREAKKLVLVLVPSIALVGQILGEWVYNAENELNPICVCSDPKVSQKRDGISVVDLGMPATTDPKQIVRQFNKASGKMTVIFSTYQSIEAISQAQKLDLPEIDIIVCDEAHRTTGVTLAEADESAFVRVHDNMFLRAAKRLYMTATPRLYDERAKTKANENNALLCSMDDENIYGAEIHRIGFGTAVEQGLLTDYKVLIFTVSENDMPKSFQHAISDFVNKKEFDGIGAKIAGTINTLSKQVIGDGSEVLAQVDPTAMKRAVAFCQNIEMSKTVTNLFNTLTNQYIQALPADKRGKMIGIQADHIDGTMNAPTRERLMTWLKAENSENACRILSNVRCLSEGVDVPALDAVVFLSPRNSQVDVVQSVGRVMRKSEGKKYGYIILPIVVPSDIAPEEALANNANYQVVWSVLNALRAHDDRFDATVNKIELNKSKRPDSILICTSDTSFDSDGNPIQKRYEQIHMESFAELQSVIYAKLVLKVGSRRYWEQWARSIAEIAEQQIKNVNGYIDNYEDTKKIFNSFLKEMQISIDASIDRTRAVEMLAQHIITAPIFSALFENYEFAKKNTVSVAMSKILDELKDKGKRLENRATNIDEDTEELQKFYEYVKRTCKDLDSHGRQAVIIELYNNFFQFAFPKLTQMLGIVYTPVEIVDFIIHSVNDVLQAEFGRKLADENVNILDPFTGTGTFITRLIQSGLIDKDNLPRKYEKELFANELVLLAYYIACVNIENCFHDEISASEYKPFDGIALTDTFQAFEESKAETRLLGKNTRTVKRQNSAPLTVIFGNPPYSVGQKSANDDAQNNDYPKLDAAIESTYAKLSTAVNKNSLYDSYIRAFRYATDRLGDNNGIVCYVSNGTWIDGMASEGFRKSIEQEFSKIFVFNLRGNQRTSGELSRKEGGKIFGSGSRTPVSITLLVKKKGFRGKAEIFYNDIGDYLTREQKLEIIKNAKSFSNRGLVLNKLTPNEYGDWIVDRNDEFDTLIPLASEKKFDKTTQSFFVMTSLGMVSGRDSFVWNYSKKRVESNTNKTIGFYNNSIDREVVFDSTQINWTRPFLDFHSKGIRLSYDKNSLSTGLYRPFMKMPFYHGANLIERRYRNDNAFPHRDAKNLLIYVNGLSSTTGFSSLITDRIADRGYVGGGQGFPLYYYEKVNKSGQIDMFTNIDEQYIRHNGISDFIWGEAQKRYGNKVTREDIFYYVYGLLHSPKYREAFAVDLKKSLPRIPLVEKDVEFWAFSKAGRELAELHLNYENVPAPKNVTVKGDKSKLRVEKMRFPTKTDKSKIVFNGAITIENISLEAYNYVVNGKSAIEWIMERYQIKTDKASGIVNDPNLYAEESGKPSYVLDLLLSVIAVSLETQKIVANLPDISFDERSAN
ncbi:MAG: DEAD/DEAH box helicase family protein [Firmicutes bacterium]|nr:DEAD/DEAH box helicase family protein [Bacillota bacterium]